MPSVGSWRTCRGLALHPTNSFAVLFHLIIIAFLLTLSCVLDSHSHTPPESTYFAQPYNEKYQKKVVWKALRKKRRKYIFCTCYFSLFSLCMGDAIMANAIWIKFKFMVWTFFYGCQFSALKRAFWRKMFMRSEDEEGELFPDANL